MKIIKYLTIILSALSLFMISGCEEKDPDLNHFDNKLYIEAGTFKADLPIKASVESITKTITSRTSKPAESKIDIVYAVNKNAVDTYNQFYYDNAVLLPDSCYIFDNTQVEIAEGGITSTEATIDFIHVNELDPSQVYVLPVEIASASNIELLESARTMYYVFTEATIIEVVGDMEENSLSINWKNKDALNNLSQMTMEGLVRARDFDRLISSFMGVEGYFLIRMGDAGFPSGQIQVATSSGNFPDADANKEIPLNTWTHIAITYDSSDGSLKVYMNDKLQSEGTKNLGELNLGRDDFFIGKSYDDNRFWAGEFSELRIWNIVRTPEELENNRYEIDPSTPGLVAYWKFNEGAGSVVKDYTSNENNAVAKNTMTWTPVKLPEPSK